MNRQSRAALSLLLIGVIAFIGWRIWSEPESTGDAGAIVISDVATRGGVLRSSLRSEPRTFNRQLDQSFPVDLFSILTGSKLVRVNRATRAVEPALAESWTTSDDGLTYTLTLRDEVAWSDGTPFTSADVVFSFQAVYDPRVRSVLASALSVNGQPLKVSAPDAKTVVVTLPASFGPGVAILDNLHLLPRHKLQSALASGTFGQSLPVTTPPADLALLGPFVLRSYEPGQRMVFDRNPRYWKKDAAGLPLPYLDQVVLEVVPDQNAELLRLQSGQIDMLQQQVRPEDVATLRPLVDQGRLRILELGVGTDPDLLFFNLRTPFWEKDPRRAWILRKEFRKAISHAVDREAFANSVFLGAGVPIWGPITPGNKEWFSPNIQRYGHSIDRAREILAELGLSNRDEDEWLEDAADNEARFTLLTYRGNSSLERGAAILRDALREVGVAVDVVALEQGALVQRMLGGQFEAIFFFFSATNLDPSMNLDFWLSSGSAHIWNMGQPKPATEWEKEIDDLMLQVTSQPDPAERRRLFEQVQKIFAENLPAIYFVAPRLHMGVSERVGGLQPAILRPQLLWNVDRITVGPDGTTR